jgi:hypothetical protein
MSVKSCNCLEQTRVSTRETSTQSSDSAGGRRLAGRRGAARWTSVDVQRPGSRPAAAAGHGNSAYSIATDKLWLRHSNSAILPPLAVVCAPSMSQRELDGAAGIVTRTTRLRFYESALTGRQIVKWTGMYLVGFVILLGGLLAALWKLGILASIGTTWTVIGVVIALGIGIMVAVSNSGAKENIEIQRK